MPRRERRTNDGGANDGVLGANDGDLGANDGVLGANDGDLGANDGVLGVGASDFAEAVAAAVTAVDAASRAHAPLRVSGEGGGGSSRADATFSSPRVRLFPGSSEVLHRELEPDREGWTRVVDGLLRALREGEAAAAAAARAAAAAEAEAEAAAATRERGDGGRRGDSYSDDVEPGAARWDDRNKNYVWDEEDAYGSDAYIDDFASGDGYGGGASGASGSSIRDRLLDLGRSAGVEAPPAAVLAELEALAASAGLGGDAAADAAADAVMREGRDEGADSYSDSGRDEGADSYSASSSSASPALRKVVLARRTTLSLAEPVDALSLVASLRARDPDAYQFALVHPTGAAFVGSTPERLFSARDGHAASEAVAGTRPRGADEGEDAALAYEMLLSAKEHEEFAIVREEVRRALAGVAEGGFRGVRAELEKGVLRHVSVQHLYARLGARLAPGRSEADVLAALHPTPAVCGYPRAAALDAVRRAETFDRGLYAGPTGWVAADSAEFAVAIRSTLVKPGGDELHLYAGVGVVAAADSAAEWHELNLKTRPLEALLARRPSLAEAPNANRAWAEILVGELVRGGVRVFCVAPGSRSTPLALAAEQHPTARVVVCVDERSLAFYALGVGKGSGRASAVITSSGTAVANLLPAAVEAHESCAPLLLLTADRPPELRDTGANQTIDQTKIFGAFARYAVDLPPPGDGAPARVYATAAAAALRHLHGDRPGPVHVNCQFRDPLGPVAAKWDPARDLRGLEGWERAVAPRVSGGNVERGVARFDGDAGGAFVDGDGPPAGDGVFGELAALVRSARRGILVVAGGGDATDALAAAAIAETLGWAVVADAASGVRVRGRAAAGRATASSSTASSSTASSSWSPASAGCPHVVDCADLMLVSPEVREFFRPDVVVQINPRVTSKRVQTMLETAALDHGAAWATVAPQDRRADPGHCVSLHVAADASSAASALAALLGAEDGAYRRSEGYASCAAFRETLRACDAAAAREAAAALADVEADEGITEMGVALAVTERLPPSDGLFLGNSMPIRDADALAGIFSRENGAVAAAGSSESHSAGAGTPVAANRGASGIDGVVSAAAGYAAGLGRPVTLLIGDVSFQHDANGLLLLRERPGQPPVTVVVVNNGGGGIFSFLPVADQIDAGAFTKLFATPPDVSRRGLCDAHRVAHSHPSAPAALRAALDAAWSEGRHSVVEVTTSRARNLEQHRELQRRVARAAAAALALRRDAEAEASRDETRFDETVVAAEVRRFSLPMRKTPTTAPGGGAAASDDARTREGWLLKVTLACGAVGWGEASPLPGLHAESTEEAGAQLRVVAALLDGGGVDGRGVRVPAELPLLGGAVGAWLRDVVGVRAANALAPSVRFAVESAALGALANASGEKKKTLAETLLRGAATFPAAEMNALVGDAANTPEKAAAEATSLVAAGHTCLKLKVARGDGAEGARADAARLLAVRRAVGPDVRLRADANRRWSLNDALTFGLQVADANLEYVEEPVACLEDLAAFHCTTGVPVALDESVDDATRRAMNAGTSVAAATAEFFEPTFGVVALVLKPSVLGGFEPCAAAAAAARNRGVAAVVSAAFESGVGVAACAHLAAALDAAAADAAERFSDANSDDANSDDANSDDANSDNSDSAPLGTPVARLAATPHGLGTGAWIDGDVCDPPCAPASRLEGAGVGVALRDAGFVAALTDAVSPACASATSWGVETFHEVSTRRGTYRFRMLDSDPDAATSPSAILLHGFMGAAEDWNAVAAGLAGTGRRIVAVDLPAHGGTAFVGDPAEGFTIEAVADAVARLVARETTNEEEKKAPAPAVIGYSLGARVALRAAAAHPDVFRGVASIGGSGGIRDEGARDARANRDDALAAALRDGGVFAFARSWYRQGLFRTLVAHPRWRDGVMARRRSGGDAEALAAMLSAASPGRQAVVAGEALAAAARVGGVTLLAGAEDAKFVETARAMARDVERHGRKRQNKTRDVGEEETRDAEVVLVRGAGHAAHLEAPEATTTHLLAFLRRVEKTTRRG